MTEGFRKENLNITLDFDALGNLMKKYKKLKKYQRSSIFAIKTLDGTETIISSLIQETKEDPP